MSGSLTVESYSSGTRRRPHFPSTYAALVCICGSQSWQVMCKNFDVVLCIFQNMEEPVSFITSVCIHVAQTLPDGHFCGYSI